MTHPWHTYKVQYSFHTMRSRKADRNLPSVVPAKNRENYCTAENHSSQKWSVTTYYQNWEVHLLDLPSFLTFWLKRTMCVIQIIWIPMWTWARQIVCAARTLVLSTYCTMIFSSHTTVNHWRRITADGEYAQCTVVDTYCTSLHVTTAKKPSYIQYMPWFVCDTRKPSAIIDHSFALGTRLVYFRSAPTLFMAFAHTARQNCQNLSKSLVIHQIPREHALRCENAQYTDESIANWHHLLGQINPCTIHHF